MPKPHVVEVALSAGGRLDKALAAAVPEELALSRSRLKALIEAGAVTREGVALRDASAKVEAGVLCITVPEAVPARDEAEDIPLDVVFEDEHLLVVNKPAGMVVHPAPGAETGTLVNALLHHCGDRIAGVGGTRRPGIVHRLDKDTSGLLVVAKSDAAHAGLSALFKSHDIEREYMAVAWGVPDAAEPRLVGHPGVRVEAGGVLRIEGRIGRHPTDRKRMAVVASGRPAVTRVRVVEGFGAFASLLSCRLETGRTHQIRVHLAQIGHALVGDAVYGRRKTAPRGTVPDAAERLLGFPRQALHAGRLGFRHPVTHVSLHWTADPPEDITGLLQGLRNSSRGGGL